MNLVFVTQNELSHFFISHHNFCYLCMNWLSKYQTYRRCVQVYQSVLIYPRHETIFGRYSPSDFPEVCILSRRKPNLDEFFHSLEKLVIILTIRYYFRFSHDDFLLILFVFWANRYIISGIVKFFTRLYPQPQRSKVGNWLTERMNESYYWQNSGERGDETSLSVRASKLAHSALPE